MDASAEFQQLALKYMDSLYNYGRLLTRNETEAEDLLQETLLHAFRGLGSLNPDLNAKVWLLKIMKHAQIDRCRRKLARPIEEELRDDLGPEEDPRAHAVPLNPEEILLRRLAIDEVRTAIRRLPPAWREVVELRDIEGLTYQEIAQVIDKPIGTVMSRLYRGRNLLRALVKERQEADLRPGSTRGL
jgi:RNA polymerase sigma-70 factor (ECF subfamily)